MIFTAALDTEKKCLRLSDFVTKLSKTGKFTDTEQIFWISTYPFWGTSETAEICKPKIIKFPIQQDRENIYTL